MKDEGDRRKGVNVFRKRVGSGNSALKKAVLDSNPTKSKSNSKKSESRFSKNSGTPKV